MKTNSGPKTLDCVFVVYAQTSAAYSFMSLGNNSICESRDAEYFELVFPLKKNHSNIVGHSNITIVAMSLPSTLNEHET